MNGTCREGKSKNLFARSSYKYNYLDCGVASFFDFGQNKVPFKKYIHFASIFGILSSNLLRLCIERGLGPLQNFQDMLHIIPVEHISNIAFRFSWVSRPRKPKKTNKNHETLGLENLCPVFQKPSKSIRY